jgi:hypothetical protein
MIASEGYAIKSFFQEVYVTLLTTIATNARTRTALMAGLLLAGMTMLGGCSSMQSSMSWHKTLHRDLPLYGDRNWIAIVDSAYPDQSKPGVDTIVTNQNMFKVLHYVLAAIKKAPNIRPVAYTDKELQFVTNTEAPGIRAYRARLDAMLAGIPHHSRMHIKSIHLLNEKGKIYKILVIKTNLTMAYTSVFIHLKCGYWTDADETALRTAMAAAQNH